MLLVWIDDEDLEMKCNNDNDDDDDDDDDEYNNLTCYYYVWINNKINTNG